MELDPRSRAVLNVIVGAYVDEAQPVSSSAVAERLRHLSLSPATVRSVMAGLETDGLLHQPHTSAGRLPTELGLRVYLDGLERPHLRRHDRALLEAVARTSPTADLPESIGSSLAEISGQVAVLGVPRFVAARVKEVALVRYDARRFVVFLVSPVGPIRQNVVEVGFDIDSDRLQQAQNFLNDKLKTMSLSELKESLRLEVEAHRLTLDHLRRQALEIGARALSDSADDHTLDLIVEGASHLVGQPEFADPRQLRALLEAIEERTVLLQLITQVIHGDGVRVVLSSEHQVRSLEDVAVVGATRVGPSGQPAAVTLLGPLRMDYGRLVPLVDFATTLFDRYWEVI
ncbi:MAG: heat-inducible transcription repressor HrcA [Deltaproteobacteria bacterium]|nr:heat-inducible transcription repressor HrcA [Deltaproteobacteria bacterium]